MLTSASTLTLDLIKDNLVKNMSEKRQLSYMRVLLVVFIVISAVLALCTEQNCWSSIWASIWPILYVGIFSSGVAYTLQIVAIKGSNPAVVSLLLSLESVFAVLSGALILHERLSARELMGCGLIFAAVILTQLPQRRKKIAPLAVGEGGKQHE